MKRTVISLVLALVLAVLLPTSALGATQQGKPDKLLIDDVTFSSSQMQFIVHMSCNPGIANRAERFGYQVHTKLTITNFIPIVLEGERGISKIDGGEKGHGGYVEIEPTYLSNNPYLSACSVTVEAIIIDAEGETVGEPTTYQGWVMTGLPGGI